MGVFLIVGTEKGAFLVRADDARARWRVEGPVFKGWKVTAAARDPGGRYYLGVASPVYGPTIQLSDDLAAWRQAPGGPSYPQGGTRKLTQIWRVHTEGPTPLTTIRRVRPGCRVPAASALTRSSPIGEIRGVSGAASPPSASSARRTAAGPGISGIRA